MRRKITVYVIFILIISMVAFAVDILFFKKAPISIALAAPMTGVSKEVGMTMQNASQMLLDEVNRKGGINGHKLKLEIYDDSNNPSKAYKKANEIAKSDCVAVIGHHYSSCSLRAGKVYEDAKIPAITSVSTNVKVTERNNWYFRTVGNDDLQASFLANYIYKILDKKNILIIRENLNYGTFIAEILKKNYEKLGGEILDNIEFSTSKTDENLYNELDFFDEKLGVDTVIFIAAHSEDGANIVKLIRDRGINNLIVGPDAFAGEDFKEKLYGFSKNSENIDYKEFYTENLFVASPLIFDSVNQKAQIFKKNYEKSFNSKPGWRAAFTYDTAKAIAESLKTLNIDFEKTDIKKVRTLLRDAIEDIVLEDGITGKVDYNMQGENSDLVSIGQFKNESLISSFLQINKINDRKILKNIDKVEENGRVIEIGDKYFYKTKLLYTGIKVNSIEELDIKNMTCIIDFHIWFKYQGEINFDDIDFFNSLNRIKLNEPVEEKKIGNVNYVLFKIRDKFKIDFVKGVNLFGKHNIGIKLINTNLNMNSFIFVNDLIALEKDENDPHNIRIKNRVVNLKKLLLNYAKKIFLMETERENLKNGGLLSSKYKWRVVNLQSYQDTWKMDSLGDPDLLNSNALIHSIYNYDIVISKNNFSVSDKISVSTAQKLLSISLILLIFIYFSRMQFNLLILEKYITVFEFLITFAFVISLNVVLINTLIDRVDLLLIEKIQKIIDSVKYLLGAFFTVKFLRYYIWEPVKRKTGYPVPSILRKIISFIIYTVSVFMIIAYVYEKEITSLLATSGLIAMIIGLAVQINLSNIISGIVINLERPFRLGDWIEINDNTIGKVVDINWRAIRLEKDSNIVSIPNHILATAKILNYDFPNKNTSCNFTLKVSNEHPYDDVEKAIKEALEKVEGSFEHYVKISNADGRGTEFSFGFRSEEFGKKYENYSSAWKNILTTFKKYEIRMVE